MYTSIHWSMYQCHMSKRFALFQWVDTGLTPVNIPSMKLISQVCLIIFLSYLKVTTFSWLMYELSWYIKSKFVQYTDKWMRQPIGKLVIDCQLYILSLNLPTRVLHCKPFWDYLNYIYMFHSSFPNIYNEYYFSV